VNSSEGTVGGAALPTIGMVFGGGLGLAAYHAGVYQAFSEGDCPLHWVAGSSAGAVTAALIAGNRSADRIDRLRKFWNVSGVVARAPDPGRHLFGWMGAIRSRLVGSEGHFHPRVPAISLFEFKSLYDLAPMREQLVRLIDFGRLNSGEIRVCIAATDIETGEPVIFDSQNEPLQIEHLMASSGFLPEFAPVEISGRLLGDGGLSLNAPFEPFLSSATDESLLLYVVDLYARDGARPQSLEAAAERKNDLLFGNQTVIRLKYFAQLRTLQKQIERKSECSGDRIVLLGYRPGMEEPGPEKSFELSSSAISQRWNAGLLDMRHAQGIIPKEGITAIRRSPIGTDQRSCTIASDIIPIYENTSVEA
jgi:NTE family protein